MSRLVSGGEFGAAVGQRVTKCDVVKVRGIGSDFDDVLMVPCEIVSKFLGDALMGGGDGMIGGAVGSGLNHERTIEMLKRAMIVGREGEINFECRAVERHKIFVIFRFDKSKVRFALAIHGW